MRDQAGSVQCESCGRWFRSRGGLAVHRCKRPEELKPTALGGAATAQGEVVCSECGRTFRQQKDLKAF